MRLIVCIGTGVPYEASWTDVFGIEYSSKEDFLRDIENHCRDNFSKYGNTTRFAGFYFDILDICHIDPEVKLFENVQIVYTVDEWFEMELLERSKYV